MEKRILILTAGFGEGHNARSPRDPRRTGRSRRGTRQWSSCMTFLPKRYGFVNDWVRRGYLDLINRAPGAWGRFYGWLDRQRRIRTSR